MVARDPDRFEHMTELQTDEVEALKYERDHKWHGSKMLWYSISLCAIGAATQGWDQVSLNSSLYIYPVNTDKSRLVPTVPTFRSRRNSASMKARRTSGLLVSSTPSSSSLLA